MLEEEERGARQSFDRELKQRSQQAQQGEHAQQQQDGTWTMVVKYAPSRTTARALSWQEVTLRTQYRVRLPSDLK